MPCMNQPIAVRFPGLRLLRALALLTIGWVTVAAAAPPPDKLISYPTDKKTIQYIVVDLAAKVGLGYNWQKSFSQTDPLCRKFVSSVSITNQPFDKAMRKILGPVGLRYEVEDGRVVLYPR